MPVTLHLGVLDVPYADEGGTTTGDVAEWLESKYHVMGVFYANSAQGIADDMAEGMAGTLESLLMGRPVHPDAVFDAATTRIKTRFSNFLLSGAIEGLGVEGVPTKASLERRSSRFKKGRAPAARPSFIDTGLYESSFMAWVDAPGWAEVGRQGASAYQGGW